MSNVVSRVEIIDNVRLRVDDSEFPTAPILVHRQDIANAVKSMLLVAPNRDFAAGVVALATSLGIRVTCDKGQNDI